MILILILIIVIVGTSCMIKGQYRNLSQILEQHFLIVSGLLLIYIFTLLQNLDVSLFPGSLISFSLASPVSCSVTDTQSLDVKCQRPRNQQTKIGFTSKVGVGEKLSRQRQNHAITEDTIPTDTAICRHLMLFLIPYSLSLSLSSP